ncbi:MAG TPA: lysylphosphatidylglycerol synthase transmembrane domain-containing protein [Thermoanaerobaculia bacterium]|nr:lysylphosphatidylglycerol synthase transmembrane domain-containing protein [Thermoanaerobaculia bacterium]
MSSEASSAPRRPRPRGSVGRLVGRLAQVVVAGLVAVLLWRAVAALSWRELGRLIAAADLRYTLLGVALLVGRYLVWTLRWRLALHSLEHLTPLPSWLHSFFTVVGAVAANGFTPTAPVVGGLLRARHGAGTGERAFGRVYGVVLFDQVAHQTVLAISGAMAAIALALWFGRAGLAVALAAVVVAGALAVSYWLRGLDAARVERIGGWLEDRLAGGDVEGARKEGRLQAIHAHARDALRAVERLLRERWLRRVALLLGVVFVVLNSLALWAFFRALGRPVDPLTAWLAVTVGVVAGGFTGTPGGVGTTEAAMVLALSAMEVSKLDAAAATLLYRGLHYVVVLVLGVPALVLLEARLRRRALAEGAA